MSAGCESSAVGELRTPSREEMLAALVERQGAANVQKLQAATVAVCGLDGLWVQCGYRFGSGRRRQAHSH